MTNTEGCYGRENIFAFILLTKKELEKDCEFVVKKCEKKALAFGLENLTLQTKAAISDLLLIDATIRITY